LRTTELLLLVAAAAGCSSGSGSTPGAGSGVQMAASGSFSGGTGVSVATGSTSGGAGVSGGASGVSVSPSGSTSGAATSGGSGASTGEPVDGSSSGAGSGAAGPADATMDVGSSPSSDAGGGDGGFVTLMDAGTQNDGDFTIGPTYGPDPNNSAMGAPAGHQVLFQMSSAQSAYYTGLGGSFMRNVLVYVPQQYVAGAPAPFLVVQDGVPRGINGAHSIGQVWLGRWDALPVSTGPNLPGTANLPNILDNLISKKAIPTLVAIFVDSGPGDYIGSERGLEYDTVGPKYGDFVNAEVLPMVVSQVKTQLGINLVLTSDPQGRAALGLSSGGAASFGMAWWHPQSFTRVVTYSGTFVNNTASTVFPHGAWVYHDVDPYSMTAANGLIVQHCTGTPAGCLTPVSQASCQAVTGCAWDTTGTQPLRMWLEAGQHDIGAGSGPYNDFLLANQRMALALKTKGYHYHYDYALGVGHADGNVIAQTLPAAMQWVWRGY
jgi:enterochelin esterase-like enzyme